MNAASNATSLVYLAVDGKVEGAVRDDEDVVDDDEVADPLREVDVASQPLRFLFGLGEALPDLVAGDDHLAHVAQHEQHDDACKKERRNCQPYQFHNYS